AFSKLDHKQEALQLYQESKQLFQAMELRQDVQDCDEAIASLEPSNWFTRFTQFSKRGKWQRILYFGAGVIAFPFALVGFVGLMAWRIVRSWVKRTQGR
ncbi:MAG: hypothetical protein LH679_05145, partial [Cyanobacteria bacterium CAN_BIN43]|nr:hypothetical protein [Cyanobacteria bacterium CAN_BIN43]